MYAVTEPIPHPERTFRNRVLLLILILVALATLSFVTPVAGARTDTQAQAVRTDTNPSGTLASVADIEVF